MYWWLQARIWLTWLAFCSVAFLAASVATAQQTQIQVQSVSTGTWPDLEVTVSVFEQDGQPVSGLSQPDFKATLNGEPLSMTSLRTTSDPGLGIAVVLAFDVSGSMAGQPLEQAKEAGRALVAQLGPDDQAAVIAFGSQVNTTQAFTSDRALLVAAIDSLGLAGDTALYGGVQASATLVDDPAYPRRAIILLSDGYDFGGVSGIGRDESIELIEQSRALTFTVGLGGDIDQEYLAGVAAAGRGQFLLAPVPEDLTTAYLSAGEVLRRQYVLGLDASGLSFDAAEAELAVEASVNGAVVASSTSLTLPDGAIAPAPDSQPEPQAPEPEPEPVNVVPEVEPNADIESLADDGEGGQPWIIISLVCLFLLFAGGAVILMPRRRGPDVAPVEVQQAPDIAERINRAHSPMVFPEIVRAAATNGSTAWIEGAGTGRIALGDSPITLGTTLDCDVRIDSPATPLARLRIWRRDGSYMVHNLSQPAGVVTIGGRPVSWAILEDGDQIVLGSATFSFRDDAAAPASG